MASELFSNLVELRGCAARQWENGLENSVLMSSEQVSSSCVLYPVKAVSVLIGSGCLGALGRKRARQRAEGCSDGMAGTHCSHLSLFLLEGGSGFACNNTHTRVRGLKVKLRSSLCWSRAPAGATEAGAPNVNLWCVQFNLFLLG